MIPQWQLSPLMWRPTTPGKSSRAASANSHVSTGGHCRAILCAGPSPHVSPFHPLPPTPPPPTEQCLSLHPHPLPPPHIPHPSLTPLPSHLLPPSFPPSLARHSPSPFSLPFSPRPQSHPSHGFSVQGTHRARLISSESSPSSQMKTTAKQRRKTNRGEWRGGDRVGGWVGVIIIIIILFFIFYFFGRGGGGGGGIKRNINRCFN